MIYRVARGGVNFSFGIGSGPFRLYYRDGKDIRYSYYLEIGNTLYKVDRVN